MSDRIETTEELVAEWVDRVLMADELVARLVQDADEHFVEPRVYLPVGTAHHRHCLGCIIPRVNPQFEEVFEVQRWICGPGIKHGFERQLRACGSQSPLPSTSRLKCFSSGGGVVMCPMIFGGMRRTKPSCFQNPWFT
jgi:hypothetical protein